MFDREVLKDLLSKPELAPGEKLLLCLAVEPTAPRSVGDIRELAISFGARQAKNWNISSYLSRTKGLAIRTGAGWELSVAGKERVASIVGPILPAVTSLVVSGLRKQLPTIASTATRGFVEESVRALEAGLYRSAIVLSWVGAVSVLYDHVINHALLAFNVEALRRDAKWKKANVPDDLAKIKESEFLNILVAISAMGKNVKDELVVCLTLRNGCGHPNSLVVGEHKAAAHIETLIQNVFSRY